MHGITIPRPSGQGGLQSHTESLNGSSKSLAAPHPAQSLAPGGTQGIARTLHSRTRCLVVKDQPSGFPDRRPSQAAFFIIAP